MHPTVKPVAMLRDAILDCSNRGDIVLDCYAGSASRRSNCLMVSAVFPSTGASGLPGLRALLVWLKGYYPNPY